MRQQRARQEWDKEDEYKAKTVIEYDHQPLNVITPALTPANVNPACKKKVIFKEPGKITDYSHSSEAEPTVHTRKTLLFICWTGNYFLFLSSRSI